MTALLLLAGGTEAPAASILQMDSFSLSADGGGSDSAMLSFFEFDPNLGTLNEVIVTLDSDWILTSALSIVGVLPGGTVRGDRENVIDLSLSGPVFMDSTSGMTTVHAEGPGNQMASDSDSDMSAYDVASSFFPAVSDAYPGTGSYTMLLDMGISTPSSSFSAGATLVAPIIHGEWAGEVSVEYLYTAIPEPSRVLLSLFGVAAVLAGRRRRKFP